VHSGSGELSRNRCLVIHTTWVPLEGGNVVQFGWYGTQAGETKATIKSH